MVVVALQIAMVAHWKVVVEDTRMAMVEQSRVVAVVVLLAAMAVHPYQVVVEEPCQAAAVLAHLVEVVVHLYLEAMVVHPSMEWVAHPFLE